MKLIFTIELMLVSMFIFAQDHGEIQGVIRDAKSGEPISYATAHIEGTAMGGISEDNGFYSIVNVPPGTYDLVISYIGYEKMSKTIEVQSGQVTEQDFGLTFTSIVGKEVTITAMALGQAKAINTQLSSTNIKNVVSEQKIRELPDANAAEALARLPGVSVTRDGGEAVAVKVRGVSSNTMFVNGMRLDGGLGSIASSMIGSIELSKAFLPDQDADVLGGNIEFKMRGAEPGFKKDIWLRTGYNGFTNSFKMHDVNALLSNRFFDDKLGVMLSLNYDKKDRGRDVLTAGYQSIGSSENSNEVLPVRITSSALDRTENQNNRYGATLYTDFKLKNGKLYYQAFFSKFDSENYTVSNNYTTAASVTYSASFDKSVQQSFLQGVGGEHNIFGANVEWSVSKSNRDTETPERLSYSAINREAVSGAGTIDTTSTINDLVGLATHDLDVTGASTLGVTRTKTYSEELAARLDIKVPFNLGNNISAYFKFGGKFRDLSRGNDANFRATGFQFQNGDNVADEIKQRMPDFGWTFIPDGNISHKVFASGTTVQDFSMFGLKTYMEPNFDRVRVAANSVNDLLNKRLTTDVNDYTNSEQYFAGYVMAGFDIGQLITFTPGIRFEKYDYSTTAKWASSTIGYGPYETQGIIRDTSAGHFYDQFYPMLHLKVKPFEWFDIRLAATKTTTRPGFTQMSPRYYKNANLDLVTGDIFLRPQTNYNLDLYLSFYTRKSGLFTVGAFYKQLTDQVLDYTVRVINPEQYGLTEVFRNKNYTFPQNNLHDGFARGLELDWQTHFSYLPKPLHGIVLNLNLTLMESETKYPFYSFTTVAISEPPFRKTEGKDDFRVNKVIGMPDVIGNIALGYELGGFAGRISAYYQSGTITTAQASNLTLDVDKDELLRLDMQLSQKIEKIPGLAIYLNVNNITNNRDRNILTHYPDRVTRQELYGVSGDIGVRFKF
ncbi:TonB-dependent receptor [Membranihabitans maritimus]|uniref:TonB-dependent receptor n=1 Tax=Membranihabitans maritimus TaxID=2904244 RepID=UPI001F41FDBE|nr:TonB-dependent receptor [Membranihabitans maritimus]